MALKCDQISEGTDKPKSKVFQKLNTTINVRHQSTIERFTKPLEGYAVRMGLSDEQLLMQIGQQNYSAVMKATDDRTTCKVFRSELERRKDWKYIIGPIMLELAQQDLPICKE